MAVFTFYSQNRSKVSSHKFDERGIGFITGVICGMFDMQNGRCATLQDGDMSLNCFVA